MVIAYLGAGARTTQVAAGSLAYQTSVARAPGQGHMIFAISKTQTNILTASSGWTLIQSVAVGTGSAAVDAGQLRLQSWFREEVTGTDAVPTLTPSSQTAADGWMAWVISFSKDPGNDWLITTDGSASDTTSHTAFSATAPAAVPANAGDYILSQIGVTTDSATISSRNISAAESGLGAIDLIATVGSTQGNDFYSAVQGKQVSLSGNKTFTTTCTLAVASTGGAQFVLLQQTPSAQNVSPTGIPSAEAFGTHLQWNVVTLQSPGIPSAEVFGNPVESGVVTLVPKGIGGNIYPNPTAASLTGYALNTNGDATVSWTGSDDAVGGDGSILLTTGTTGYAYVGQQQLSEMVGGLTFTISAMVKPSVNFVNVIVRNPNNGYFGFHQATGLIPNVWQQITVTHTVETGAPWCVIDFGWEAGQATGTTLLLDGVDVEEVKMGTPSISQTSPNLTLSPVGIASAEAFGVPARTSSVILTPVGLTSAEAFGVPVLAIQPPGQNLSPVGIASAEAFGVPSRTSVVILSPTGIPTAEVFGVPVRTGVIVLSPTGIASAEAVGVPLTSAIISLAPVGIPSAFVAGVPVLAPVVTLSPVGIASSEAFGIAAAGFVSLMMPVGIPSAEAFGMPVRTSIITATPVGIASVQAFGVPVRTSAITLTPVGIASLQAFGVPVRTSTITLGAIGIISGEVFGFPVLGGSGAVFTFEGWGIPLG